MAYSKGNPDAFETAGKQIAEYAKSIGFQPFSGFKKYVIKENINGTQRTKTNLHSKQKP